jgi:hypothetical protein
MRRGPWSRKRLPLPPRNRLVTTLNEGRPWSRSRPPPQPPSRHAHWMQIGPDRALTLTLSRGERVRVRGGTYRNHCLSPDADPVGDTGRGSRTCVSVGVPPFPRREGGLGGLGLRWMIRSVGSEPEKVGIRGHRGSCLNHDELSRQDQRPEHIVVLAYSEHARLRSSVYREGFPNIKADRSRAWKRGSNARGFRNDGAWRPSLAQMGSVFVGSAAAAC